MRVRLPTPDEKLKDPKEIVKYLRQLIQALEHEFGRAAETPFTKDRIKVTGLTKQYTLDSAAGTLGDTRSVLGTLLQDLQTSGKLS